MSATWLDVSRLCHDVGYQPNDRPERAMAGSIAWLGAGIDQ